ncbi:IclR family transcriptional regulator [Microbacterium sp. RD1]|uniref:IclR family transcriptional regulator n=1 Tax=Microbacterium sp. RD1 TaxID=3457313 RepID=UPI003FA57C96
MTTSSIERGLAILEVVAAAGDASVRAVADRTGLPVSSVYRYVRQLEDAGFLAVDGGQCRPGRRLLQLGGSSYVHSFLAETAPALLRAVVEETGETCVLIVRVGSHALCLRRAEPDRSMKYSFAVGELLPLHAGAGQRVLLAGAPARVAERVLDGDLPAYTARTLRRDQLLAALAQTRVSGWAVSRGELDPGSVSVAVPVSYLGEVVCSLNVAGPESRCDRPEWIRLARTSLMRAADDLAQSLTEWADLDARRLRNERKSRNDDR